MNRPLALQLSSYHAGRLRASAGLRFWLRYWRGPQTASFNQLKINPEYGDQSIRPANFKAKQFGHRLAA
jgi:hypothetical protein